MPVYNPQFARQRILRLFETMPELTFEATNMRDLDSRFPQFQRPQEAVEQFRDETGAPMVHELGHSATSLPPTLVPLLNCLARSIRRFRYGHTPIADWETYFRFSGDRLQRLKGHRYRIVNAATNEQGINASKDAAEHWFRNVLVASIKANNSRRRHMLIGDPGAGKSSLVKYLINTNWCYLQNERVIFSRFEFMKFMKRPWRGRQTLPQDMDAYISWILLRDAVLLSSYDLIDGTRYQRKFNGPFSNAANLAKLKAKMLVRFPNLADQHTDYFFAQIAEACRPDSYDDELVLKTDPELRIYLLDTFVQEPWEIVLLLDGMDHVSIEDSTDFETDHKFVLDYLHDNASRLTCFDATIPQGVQISTSLVTVMRENTALLHFKPRKDDVWLTREQIHRFRPINPRVVLYNALRHSLGYWSKLAPGAGVDTDLIADRIMRVVDLAIEIINRDLGVKRGQNTLYEAFGADLRSFLKFIGRLMSWYIAELIKQTGLSPTSTTLAEDVVSAMVGREGVRILKWRKYRLVSMLLFTDLPWFENAVTVLEKPDSLLVRLGAVSPTGGPSLTDNVQYSGFFDNILNYHIARHENNADKHCLLEKLRAVQMLRERDCTLDELENLLHNRIGYRSEDLYKTVVILLRAQLIKAIVHQGSELRITLRATRRGLFAVDHLIKHVVYLENIFHQTLLPSVLTQNILGRQRELDVLDWTSQSIRNLYVLCTYIQWVEANRAENVAVPQSLCVFAGIKERILKTVENILSDDLKRLKIRPERADSGATSVAIQAHHLIDTQLKNWFSQGLIAKLPPE